MRRVARHLFTLCSAVLLVACVAGLALWARGHIARDTASVAWERRADDHRLIRWRADVTSASGRLGIRLESATKSSSQRLPRAAPFALELKHDPPGAGLRAATVAGFPGQAGWSACGFTYQPGSYTLSSCGSVSSTTVARTAALAFPVWVPAVIFAPLPAFYAFARLRKERRSHRRRNGLCPSCGYDLRASPGRCPECGAARVG